MFSEELQSEVYEWYLRFLTMYDNGAVRSSLSPDAVKAHNKFHMDEPMSRLSKEII